MEQTAQLLQQLLPLGHNFLQLWYHLRKQANSWEHEYQADQLPLEQMKITGPLDWSLPESPQPPPPRMSVPSEDVVLPELWQLAYEGQLPLKTPNLSLRMVHMSQRYYLAKYFQSWHCTECQKNTNSMTRSFTYSTPTVCWESTTGKDPGTRGVHAGISRVASIADCTPYQQAISMNHPYLNDDEECYAIFPRELIDPRRGL